MLQGRGIASGEAPWGLVMSSWVALTLVGLASSSPRAAVRLFRSPPGLSEGGLMVVGNGGVRGQKRVITGRSEVVTEGSVHVCRVVADVVPGRWPLRPGGGPLCAAC